MSQKKLEHRQIYVKIKLRCTLLGQTCQFFLQSCVVPFDTKLYQPGTDMFQFATTTKMFQLGNAKCTIFYKIL